MVVFWQPEGGQVEHRKSKPGQNSHFVVQLSIEIKSECFFFSPSVAKAKARGLLNIPTMRGMVEKM